RPERARRPRSLSAPHRPGHPGRRRRAADHRDPVVRAEDRAGNSTSVTRTITVDRTAPTVAIGEPGAAVNPDATMRVYATWGEPAAFVKILVDGGLVDAREVEGAISMSYPLGARPGWAEGSTHTFRVEVTDRAGNVG